MKVFDFRVAKYAKALLKVGRGQEFFDSLNADIQFLEDSLLKQKDYVLDYVLTDGVLQELENKGINVYLVRILKIMKKNKDMNLLKAFFNYWATLYKKSSNALNVEIYSVVELSETQSVAIKEILKQSFEQELKVTNIVKKDILGGLIVKVGNYIFDDSFFSKLSSLKRENEV